MALIVGAFKVISWDLYMSKIPDACNSRSNTRNYAGQISLIAVIAPATGWLIHVKVATELACPNQWLGLLQQLTAIIWLDLCEQVWNKSWLGSRYLTSCSYFTKVATHKVVQVMLIHLSLPFAKSYENSILVLRCQKRCQYWIVFPLEETKTRLIKSGTYNYMIIITL